MKLIDISEAVISHLAWKSRLKDFLEGKEHITEQEAFSHSDCDLGQWLYSDVMPRYSTEPEVQELEQVHRELHDTVKSVLQMKYGGKASSALQELSKLELLSEKLFSLLLAIKVKMERSKQVERG